MDKKTILFRIVKGTSIGIVGLYYFVSCLILSNILNTIFPEYDEKKYKNNNLKLIGEIFLIMFIIMFSVYFIRITIKRIYYSPFENFINFHGKQLKELNGTIVSAFTLFLYQDSLKKKMLLLNKKLLNFIK